MSSTILHCSAERVAARTIVIFLALGTLCSRKMTYAYAFPAVVTLAMAAARLRVHTVD